MVSYLSYREYIIVTYVVTCQRLWAQPCLIDSTKRALKDQKIFVGAAIPSCT